MHLLPRSGSLELTTRLLLVGCLLEVSDYLALLVSLGQNRYLLFSSLTWLLTGLDT